MNRPTTPTSAPATPASPLAPSGCPRWRGKAEEIGRRGAGGRSGRARQAGGEFPARGFAVDTLHQGRLLGPAGGRGLPHRLGRQPRLRIPVAAPSRAGTGAATREAFLQYARSLGYRLDDLVHTPHTGRRTA